MFHLSGDNISLAELNEKIIGNRCAFIFGNGFSVNFDSDFSKIYDNLYSAHREVLNSARFNVKSNKAFANKFIENYKSVMHYLRYFKEADFNRLFEDAVVFAESIKNNEQLIADFWEAEIISKLTFGMSQVDPLNRICEVAKEKGIYSVNIEHWTVLIYFYAAIKNRRPSYYELPSNNSFIAALKHGDKNKSRLSNGSNKKYQLFEDVIFNGFTSYFRMLFSIAIFSKGKAVDLDKLRNKDNLDLDRLAEFLNQFSLLLSLNYDRIVEEVTGKEIEHLHGEFVLNKEEYVYNQSLGMNFDGGYVSFSDVLIGDYFTFKSMLPIVNKLSSTNGLINKKTPFFSEKANRVISENSITTAVIFGMNIENDYHVLRHLMLGFEENDVQEPHIIYSYFTEQEKQDFQEEIKNVITFSEEINDYCRNIKVSYVQTQEILAAHFYKQLEK